MTEKAIVQRALIILAVYSLLFSFIAVPYALGVGGPYVLQVGLRWFVVIGAIAFVPSGIYWIIARRLMARGTEPWTLLMIHAVVIIPITLALMFALLLAAMSYYPA